MKHIISLFIVGLLLTGCTTTTLKAPCPNYGKHCTKVPVNSWDYVN